MRESRVRSLAQEDPREEGMATYSSILALKNPHGQRNLAGYRPWGHTESGTTERLTLTHSGCVCVCVCVTLEAGPHRTPGTGQGRWLGASTGSGPQV